MKLTKVLLGSAFAVSSVAIPVTTLSSCGTSWGVLTPFSIGGTSVDDGPFSILFSDSAYAGDDADGDWPAGYIQSNYSVDTKNNTNYAYATPKKWNDETKKWDKIGSSGWYTSGDEAFASTKSYEEDGKTKTATCARNASLSGNTDFVTTIASTIKTYLEGALNYQGSQAKTIKDGKKLKGDDSNVKIAWGSENGFALNHGELGNKDDIQNKNFFEYLFANANINSSGKSKALLRTSNVNMKFNGLYLPTYEFGEDEKRDGLSDNFWAEIEGGETSYTPDKYWSDKSEQEDPDDHNIKYTRYTYKSVPFIVSVYDITQTYVNATNKKGSFLVSDYYSSSNDIKDSIGNSWKKVLPAFTGDDDNFAPTKKSFKLKTKDFNHSCILGCKDERMDSWICGRDFIMLMDYTINLYGDDHPEKTTAQISKLSNVFPAYLLDLYGDEMYTHARADDESSGIIINSDKVDEKTSVLLQLLNRTSKEGMKAEAKNLNDESKKLLSFIGYMFGNREKKINTDEIFDLVDL